MLEKEQERTKGGGEESEGGRVGSRREGRKEGCQGSRWRSRKQHRDRRGYADNRAELALSV